MKRYRQDQEVRTTGQIRRTRLKYEKVQSSEHRKSLLSLLQEFNQFGCANLNPDNLCLMCCAGLHEYQRGLRWFEAPLQGSVYLLLPTRRRALENLKYTHFVKLRFCHQFGFLIGWHCRYMLMASLQRKLRGSSCQASALHCHAFSYYLLTFRRIHMYDLIL